MRPFTRVEGPPAAVVDRAGLARGEKVLAATPSGDTWLLGTRLALVVVRPDLVDRIPWELVEKAGWDLDESVLQVSEVGRWGIERPVHRFPLEEPGRLLELVRERVTASVVMQRRVEVDGRRGLTVSARRSPTGGEVAWFVEYDEGVDPDDPVVADLAQVGLADAQAELI
jgi:hypothetical protein